MDRPFRFISASRGTSEPYRMAADYDQSVNRKAHTSCKERNGTEFEVCNGIIPFDQG